MTAAGEPLIVARDVAIGWTRDQVLREHASFDAAMDAILKSHVIDPALLRCSPLSNAMGKGVGRVGICRRGRR